MTAALNNLISTIPTLSEAEFALLVEAVFSRMSSQGGMAPLNGKQWAEKLDHSLAQARDGRKSDACTLTTRIRNLYS